MQKRKLTFTVLLLLMCTSLLLAQEIASHRNAANLLWTNYDQNPSNPSSLPNAIPLNVNIPNLDKKVISPNYNALKSAIIELAENNGGVISFSNSGSRTISFNDVNKAIDVSVAPNKPIKTILIQGANKIVFDGSNKSSIFVIRKQLRVIVQDAVFQNATLKKGIIQNASLYREGGGAVEVWSGASFRARGCTFKNNRVEDYDYVGENQNGAGIRFNNRTTGELFDCTFKNNKAVTGGAVAGTSIDKLTVINSVFDGNISNSYNTKNSNKRRVPEGAGAIRIDRTAKPVEIYGTKFINNAGNLKVSVIEVFIYPIKVNGRDIGAYPNPNSFSLIIDNCLFKNNKYYNFQGANDPKRDDWYYGCILHHSGSVNPNSSFVSAKMKISNTQFIGNEVGEANLRIANDFLIEKCIFANTKLLRLPSGTGESYVKGAIMLQKVPNSGEIKNCTFYKNEPLIVDNLNTIATGVFFWGDFQSKVTIKNSIFYRSNKNSRIKQVIRPVKGSGNVQYIPDADMSLFADVTNASVNKTNPNIRPNNITDMCLGSNSLPNGIGGLPNCGSSGSGGSSSSASISNGTYFLESNTNNQRLEELNNHKAFMRNRSSSNKQKWIFRHLGGNVYSIKNKSTNRFLEIPHAECTNGAQAATYTQASETHQKWRIELNGNQIYSIKPNHCLARGLDRNNGTRNTNAHIWDYSDGNGNQKWKITPVNSRVAMVTTDIKDGETESGIEIYPNPAKEFVTVKGLKVGDTISIYNLLGKLVISMDAKSSEETISSESLTRGLYIVSVSGSKPIKLKVE